MKAFREALKRLLADDIDHLGGNPEIVADAMVAAGYDKARGTMPDRVLDDFTLAFVGEMFDWLSYHNPSELETMAFVEALRRRREMLRQEEAVAEEASPDA